MAHNDPNLALQLSCNERMMTLIGLDIDHSSFTQCTISNPKFRCIAADLPSCPALCRLVP